MRSIVLLTAWKTAGSFYRQCDGLAHAVTFAVARDPPGDRVPYPRPGGHAPGMVGAGPGPGFCVWTRDRGWLALDTRSGLVIRARTRGMCGRGPTLAVMGPYPPDGGTPRHPVPARHPIRMGPGAGRGDADLGGDPMRLCGAFRLKREGGRAGAVKEYKKQGPQAGLRRSRDAHRGSAPRAVALCPKPVAVLPWGFRDANILSARASGRPFK
jgi:hypothetical protein